MIATIATNRPQEKPKYDNDKDNGNDDDNQQQSVPESIWFGSDLSSSSPEELLPLLWRRETAIGIREDRPLCRFTCPASSVQLCSLSLLERDILIGILDFCLTAERQIPLSLAIFCDAMSRFATRGLTRANLTSGHCCLH